LKIKTHILLAGARNGKELLRGVYGKRCMLEAVRPLSLKGLLKNMTSHLFSMAWRLSNNSAKFALLFSAA
jgi:hypothetical protein